MNIHFDDIVERGLMDMTKNPTIYALLGYQIIGTTFDIPTAEHAGPKAFRYIVLRSGAGQTINELPITGSRKTGIQTSNER